MKMSDLPAQAAASLAPRQHLPNQRLQSFDVFDTLIARRCITPAGLFELVEQRSGASGFALARASCEQRVASAPYTLLDIYRELGRLAELPDDVLEHLMQLEVQIELENVLPIAQHLDALPADALLISDTYLPPAVIREMLRVAGLSRDLPLLLRSDGKSSGEVWRTLAAHQLRCVHLGDNEHSDVQSPRQGGMLARRTTLAQPTELEQMLVGRGARAVAETLRAARLATAHGDLPDWLLRLHNELNLPFLLVSAADLLSKAIDGNARGVLFSSRGGRALQTAFDTVRQVLGIGQAMQSTCWHTSRLARSRQSSDYLAYCVHMLQDHDWVVDLCGSGASLSALFADLPATVARPQVYFAQQTEASPHTQNLFKRYGESRQMAPIHPLHTFSTGGGFVPDACLRQLNGVAEGMTLDVSMTPFGPLPLRDSPEFDAQTLALLAAQHSYVQRLLQALPLCWTPEASEQLPSACSMIYEWLLQSVPRLRGELARLRACVGIDALSNENAVLGELVRGATLVT